MEKQKSWQLFLIIAVLVLTVYNILPTIFYYARPLKEPINAVRAKVISEQIAERVDQLEVDSKEWLQAFCKHLRLSPTSIEFDPSHPRWFVVTFPDARQAGRFSAALPTAGALIPFIPAQLELGQQTDSESTSVRVERRIGIHFSPENLDRFFTFSPRLDEKDQISPLWRTLVNSRVAEIALHLTEGKQAYQLATVVAHPTEEGSLDDMAIELAREIVMVDKVFGDSPLTKRIYASFLPKRGQEAERLVRDFSSRLEALKGKIDTQKNSLAQGIEKQKELNQLVDATQEQQVSLLDNQGQTLAAALQILRKKSADFVSKEDLPSLEIIQGELSKEATSTQQAVSLYGANPFIQQIDINWLDSSLSFVPYEDVQAIRSSEDKSEMQAYRKDRLNLMLINEIARLSRVTGENISPLNETFVIKLNTLSDMQSFLVLNLGEVAAVQVEQLINQLNASWVALHTDLQRQNYPVLSYAAFQALPAHERKLGLIVYAPATERSLPPQGFRNSSIYVIARGIEAIAAKYQQTPESPEAKQFVTDLNALKFLLQQNGFISYSSATFALPEEFQKDWIFELNDYYSNLLLATRENFQVHGNKREAVLEFSDVEQRLLAENKIDNRIHEDLLKWKEEYQAAQVDPYSNNKYFIPHPTKNVYWDNFKLTMLKYFRGDDRKILRWGLDLSGGKMVRIGLRDPNNRPVTQPEDLNQAVNELYGRINKMGVAERSIRVENSNIILEFPGVQGLSANELIKASAMYFHVANEKFTPTSPVLGAAVKTFLQEVWNEAVVTNRKDSESLNEIAWKHLGEGDEGESVSHLRSEAAQLLYDNGLRLAGPNDKIKSSAFNDSLSSIARFRGDDYSSWYGQSHPLIIVFHNYALEGSSLADVQVGYDPSEGNILMFSVKRSYENRQGSPRDDFYQWTSQFAEDRIAGTPKEQYTQGRGWRLAVILNGEVINWPTLKAALKDNGTISGRFTQREITNLAADLKAGSLSFTPRILSENNISPELGQEERHRGILAALVGMGLVVGIMIAYYRFAGVVAACAVLLTLPIMWAILQNLGAALSLPGIAAVVLTIGMAVDANVLVFERTREEFKISGRIASALQAGYRKAFNAIFDSNITTIIAALILTQFDSGPIKGFAITLIIGIVASMFTTLFLTRYYFAGWVKNPNHKELHMSEWVKNTNFDFLKWTKPVLIASLVIICMGSYFLVAQRNTIFGMDFTGGYSLTVDLEERPHVNYRLAAIHALEAQHLSSNDFQVRELSRPEQIMIQLSTRMEEPGHPFYGLPEELTEEGFHYAYQKNPRIAWVVETLAKEGLSIAPAQLQKLDTSWSAMSGQLSDAMRNNALIALGIAMLAILIYITFRFEFKYGIAAIVGLIHDVLITLAILALLYKLGAPVQIDLQVVGAIMTLIGYSLNDTIIIFDRIREDSRLLRKLTFPEVIRHALNVTLSRTLMTSGTTLVALLALVCFGGSTIFTFSLVMTIGVVIGTLSSLFVCSPVLLFFHNREAAHVGRDNNSKAPAALMKVV